jgi:hypothetical protein
MIHETVGSAALRLLKDPTPQGVVDTQREMQKKYVDNVLEAVERGKNLYPKADFFYVCVHTRRERLLTNVIRNIFHPRQTRPIPQYDLALYHFDVKEEKLSFVWCIPDKETVHHLVNEVSNDKQDEQLTYFCKLFVANTLI